MYEKITKNFKSFNLLHRPQKSTVVSILKSINRISTFTFYSKSKVCLIEMKLFNANTLQSTRRFNVCKHDDLQKMKDKHLNHVTGENVNEINI